MTIAEIKHLFYTYRNGIVADALRKAGDKHKFIFGLNLPQIKDIAKLIGKDATLALELWNNINCRESQLLAPMVFPTEKFSEGDALKWIEELPNYEIADMMCHQLLANLDFAEKLAFELMESDKELSVYCGLRLSANLLQRNKISDIQLLYTTISKINIESNKVIAKLRYMLKEEIEYINSGY